MKAESQVDLSADMIDVRDIIERIEEIEKDRNGYDEDALDAWRENYPGDEEELEMLMEIMDDLEGGGGDEQWRGAWYPVMVIRGSYFEEYAQQTAEDCGMVNKDAGWPNNHLDWEAAADELKIDYTEIEIDGNDYWFR